MIRLFKMSAVTRIPANSVLENVRFLSQSTRIFEKSPSTSETQNPAAATPTESAQAWEKKTVYTNVSSFDKRVLVSVGKYKSVNEVPDKVTNEVLERARDKFRVKMCIYMMIACIIICIIQVIRGKQAAEQGESVVGANMEWHRQYNEAANNKEDKAK